MLIHIEKRAIRALGVAESFLQNDKRSTLAGVVMRSDLVVDGFAMGSLEVSGSDATRGILSLYERLERNDLNCVLLSGSILSLYNIVDVDELGARLELPVVALTFRKSKADLQRNIRRRFSASESRSKIKLLEKLGTPRRLQLWTGYPVFVRAAGASLEETKKILDKFTIQGAIPEPIRVARLLARAASSLKLNKPL